MYLVIFKQNMWVFRALQCYACWVRTMVVTLSEYLTVQLSCPILREAFWNTSLPIWLSWPYTYHIRSRKRCHIFITHKVQKIKIIVTEDSDVLYFPNYKPNFSISSSFPGYLLLVLCYFREASILFLQSINQRTVSRLFLGNIWH